MKVALVGIGGMGKNHFNIYQKFDDIDFVAGCDIRSEITDDLASKHPDMKFYNDFSKMLEEIKPDVVDICTPTYLHAEHTALALRAGAHVICEKPMALSSAETESVIEEVKKSGKSFMAAHVVRFMRAYVYLAEAIKSQKHGKLLKLQLRRISGTPTWSWDNWFLDKKRSGHVVLDLMIHDIDFMQSVLGQPKDIVGAHYEYNDLTNYASAIYLYDGCSVSVESGWFKSNPPFTADYFAVFENGYIILKDGQVNDNGEIQELSKADVIKSSGINISNVDGYAGECRYFIDRIKEGKKPDFITPESSAAAVKLVEMTIEKATKI